MLKDFFFILVSLDALRKKVKTVQIMEYNFDVALNSIYHSIDMKSVKCSITQKVYS